MASVDQRVRKEELNTIHAKDEVGECTAGVDADARFELLGALPLFSSTDTTD